MIIISSIWDYIKVNYGNVASVVGLIITYLVYRDVSKLRRHYTFVGRADEFIDRLRKHTEGLTGCLNDFTGSQNRITSEMSLIQATLETLEKVAANPQKKPVKRLLSRTRKYSIEAGLLGDLPWTKMYKGEQGLRAIHDNLLYVTQTVVDAQENLKYE